MSSNTNKVLARNARNAHNARSIDPETGFAPLSDQELRKTEIKLNKFNKQEALEAQQEREELLTDMLNDMRRKGASENAIFRATPGLREYLHPHTKRSPLAPDELGQLEQPGIEASGTLLSDVEPRPLTWLWQERIPLGKITILDGDPGMGKSLFSLHVAAAVTTGSPMPDGSACPQGGVILIAPEDSAADTIRPRFEAAGGDPSKVLLLTTVTTLDKSRTHIIERPFSLADDLALLAAWITRMQASLVVIDPLMAVIGQHVDSSSDQQVRQAFTPLAQLAECTGCAILIIRHLTKGHSSNPLYRGSGSIGIIAAARTGLLIAQDPDNQERRVLASTINNLGKLPPNLIFEVVQTEQGIPTLHWQGENRHSVAYLIKGNKPSIIRQEILKVLKDSALPLGPLDIANRAGQDYDSVRKALARMLEDETILQTARGKYLDIDHPGVTRANVTIENITEEERDLLTKEELADLRLGEIFNPDDSPPTASQPSQSSQPPQTSLTEEQPSQSSQSSQTSLTEEQRSQIAHQQLTYEEARFCRNRGIDPYEYLTGE